MIEMIENRPPPFESSDDDETTNNVLIGKRKRKGDRGKWQSRLDCRGSYDR
jgi:hypothetical protein